MPIKNSRKEFVADSYYHLYNRGVEKRIIFADEQDYKVFLSYLKTYLLPKDEKALRTILSSSVSWAEKDRALKLLRLNNFADNLSLISYCLMSNHFHFLVKQTDADTIDRFTNSLLTRYVLYFNKKYKRVGPLFQSRYKAVYVDTIEQLLHLTRYIHRNAFPLLQGQALQSYSYSSYKDYLGTRNTEWIKPNEILNNFALKGFNSYESFVENHEIELEEQAGKLLNSLTIDDE